MQMLLKHLPEELHTVLGDNIFDELVEDGEATLSHPRGV